MGSATSDVNTNRCASLTSSWWSVGVSCCGSSSRVSRCTSYPLLKAPLHTDSCRCHIVRTYEHSRCCVCVYICVFAMVRAWARMWLRHSFLRNRGCWLAAAGLRMLIANRQPFTGRSLRSQARENNMSVTAVGFEPTPLRTGA